MNELNLGIGVNIGNTLDCISRGLFTGGETGWRNPKITRDYIKALKAHGFKTIRLPVTWIENMGGDPEYTIAEPWMARVETVVNWILDEDLCCILNLHHDGGEAQKSWIRKLAVNEAQIIKQFEKVWQQIAVRFRDASNKLILESANEIGFDDLWNRREGGQEMQKAEAYRKLNLLNQTFVDTVQAAGGNNKTRYLLVTGYWTDIENTCEPLFKMPQNTAENKLILSLHYYTPWSFCDGKRLDWGTQDDIDELNCLFDKLKTAFIDQGIPVILGEYAALTIRDNPERETYRVKWMAAVTQKCLDMGICPVLWDTGSQHPRNCIMGDINRDPPFDMSDSLKEMLSLVKLPESSFGFKFG